MMVVLPSVLSPLRWKPPPSIPTRVSSGAAKASDSAKHRRELPTANPETPCCHSAKVPRSVKSLAVYPAVCRITPSAFGPMVPWGST
ncbi:hypothetical protein D3C78_1396580 [compost metagenome]